MSIHVLPYPNGVRGNEIEPSIMEVPDNICPQMFISVLLQVFQIQTKRKTP
jgi:hypothetical protein